MTLEAAKGTTIPQYGNRSTPNEEIGAWQKCEKDCLVADIAKSLAAGSAMVNTGNIVVFGKDEPYIEDPQTGERIVLQWDRGSTRWMLTWSPWV